ncbi:MAG: TIGR04283 family arsenosugar biosynthesis glycosyltransferase [Microcoleaceae cyanobacterium]
MATAKISIIIPVLNEAASIGDVVKQALTGENVEIIVSDGGSLDQTVEVVQSLGIAVVHSSPGRSQQMNLGAKQATGEILLFLHADTYLPDQFDRIIRQSLTQPQVIAGAFNLKIAAHLPGIHWVEKMVNWRSRFFQLPYGDQAIFLKTSTFWQIGGFPDLPIMEDFELMQKLRKKGKIAIASVAVVTSGRRWQRLGILKTTLLNQLIIIGYFCKISPDRLAQYYRNQQLK